MIMVKRSWKRFAALTLCAVVVMAAAAVWYLRGRNSPPIASAGGRSFTNFVAIQTPFYLQRDERWRNERIAGGETLGEVGCTVSSLAMALDHYGISFTPRTLNEELKSHGGYTPRGWLKWLVVEKVSNGKVRVDVLARPTHDDLDAALRAGEPILAKVFIKRVIPHWVLLVGKEGQEYLMRDPLNDARTLEPLSKYSSDIFGIRIVKPAGGKVTDG
jgi:hypothetical protein